MELSPARRGAAPLSSARRCVLLVEDEILIRVILGEELREAGYHVIEAFNADEATAILKSVVPDLIITDVRMPGSLDGLGLIAHVRDTFPKLPVIVTSGHMHHAMVGADSASRFFPKPYSMELLVKAVHDELAKSG